MEQGQGHHPPEDVCWVHPTDSLAFSVSPAGPSTSNSTRGGSNNLDEEDKFFNKSRDEETDEDRPLMGEYIWDAGGGGGGGGGNGGALDDKRRVETPLLRIERSRRSVDDQGFASVPGRPPSPRNGTTNDGRSGAGDDGDTAHSSLYAMGQSWEPQQDEGTENERSLESPRGMDEDTYNSVGISESEDEEGPQRHDPRAPDESPRQEERDAFDQGEGWADNDNGVEHLAPAWDEGRSPECDGEETDNSQLSRSDPLDEARAASRGQNQSHEASPEYYAGGSDRGMDAAYYYSSNEAVGVVEPPLVGRESSLSPVTRRRTRSSLDRERRRLDRVPRSQRLNQVKGHPLGGMTLLELEERHLLDVGIGQMARQLENRRAAGGVRRPDADLLRRSARLLRRAQEDRDARSFFEENDGFRKHGTTSLRSRDSTRNAGSRGAARGRSKGIRRPASASRDRCHLITPSSLSLESEENIAWARGSEHGPKRTDGRRYTAEGDPLVGLYSGGGAKCSLQQRRPMSAKPALTCGSGWEPGRTNEVDRTGERRDCEHARGGGEGAARTGAGKLEGGYGGSDMSDLSPQGIVEYTDEEEGPFNVDELERVAATYLLRPSGSIYQSSFTVADDRFADDGSVYIYREENGPPSARGQEGEERNGESSGGRNCRDRSTLSQDVEWDQRNHWERDGGEASAAVIPTGNSNNRDRRRMAPGGDHAGITFEGSVNGSNGALNDPPAGRDGGGDAAAGVHHRDRSGEGKMLRQPPESSNADQASAKGAGGGDCQKRGARAPHEGGGGPGQDANRALFDDCTSRPDHGRREAAPLETLDTEPGARTSGSTGREGAPRDNFGGKPAAGSSRKVEQVAARLREMILDRQASAGRSVRQVFGHFDRRRCGYVNVSEMRDALADLRLNVSPDQAQEMHSMIALDGGDRLSYAEFAVFVSDPRHFELQAHVCEQAAKQLEGLGRRSFNLDVAFHPARLDTTALNAGTGPKPAAAQQTREDQHTTTSRHKKHRCAGDVATGRAAEQHGGGGGGDERQIISTSEFLAGLEALGLGLSTSDAQRLVVRFDVHGDGYLSAGRFVAMVESSRPWTRALARLAQQEEADEEADAYLRAQRVHGRCPGGHALSAEIIEMARYVGIRVSSDSSLLWIAADALAAPLPEGWVMYKGQEGRWFYHNELTGQSRWDHPLDPHFRSVYLRERFGSSYGEEKEADCEGAGRARGAAGPNLPPRRNRPSILDFPADKALENLRARRLDSGSGGGRSQAAAPGAPTAPAVVSPTSAAARTGSDLWTERAGGAVPAGSAVPRRRRPVSASALRDGIQESGLGGTKVTVGGARPDRGGRGGFGSSEMAEVLYAGGSRVGPNRAERGPGARRRRPCSARAALQRPPDGHQSNDARRGERHDDRHLPGVAANEKSQRSGQASAATLDDERWVAEGVSDHVRAAPDDRGRRNQLDWGGGGGAGISRDSGGRTKRPEGRPEGRPVATNHEQPWGDREAADIPTAAEKERAWIRCRLADLCGKLDETETHTRSDSQRSGVSRDAHGSSPRGGESRQDPSRSQEFHEAGVGSDNLGRQAMCGTHAPSAVDVLSPSEDGGSPSSGNASLLKEQVVELTNRMRYLETLLHDPHRRHRDSREHHLQRPHSFSSARGAVALARTAARGRQRDGTKSGHGGGGGGGGTSNSNKRASQDDWANNLSKRSWPPPSGTIDGRRAAMPPHSYGGSSGSLLSPVGEAAAANCVPRWEGLTPNQANRRRRNSGGGGKGATRTSSGGRVGRDNPPGIVLI